MNHEIEKFTRNRINDLLSDCTEDQQMMFKRMYSHKDLHKPISDVVSSMPEDKLDWALTQIQNTVNRDAA